MGIILFIAAFIIVAVGIWFYLTAQNTASSDSRQPMVKILCQDGYIVGYYQGRQLYGQRFVNNQLASEGIFINAVQVGPGKEYYPNGVLKYEGNFANGHADGQGKLYEENGKLKYIGNFTDGYASGSGRIFDGNGKLKCEGNFARLPGNQVSSKDPSAPSGYCQEYYDNGQVKYAGEFLNGVWHGEGCSYDRNGRLVFKGTFAYGKPVNRS